MLGNFERKNKAIHGMRHVALSYTLAFSLLGAYAQAASVFQFPTANHTLLQENGDAHFFVGTPGRPWTAGSFGCVRSSGYQFHEGADIRSIARDKRNEPTDPVLCTADGWVVHTNRKAGLSNYGKYVVVGHKVEGLEIYSIYAHLSRVNDEWKPGKWIAKGAQIGIMGRTSNTRQRISKERAHLHFEITLLANHEFPDFFKKKYPKGRNDHGIWNGQNLIGIDPAEVFRAQAASPAGFKLRDYLREQAPLFKLRVHQTEFAWIKRYRPLILRSPELSHEQVDGYEIAFNYGGLPYQLKPIAIENPPAGEPWELIHVDEAVYQKHPCRKLVIKTGAKWRLTAKGRQLIELLLFAADRP